MLRDYQIEISKESLRILQENGLLYLAMEVRCGKTLTSLNIANMYGAKRVLFVTKKKAIASIKKDLDMLAPSFELYVVNYESIAKVDPKDFDFVILDEAHSMGQFPKIGERTKTIKKVCDLKPIIYLSGTPTPESYSQIYHQLYVSSNSPFRDYKNFYAWAKDGFVNIKQRRFSHGIVNDYKDANKEKIDHFTKHLFISFTQQQAGFTQSVEETVLKVKMKESTYMLASKLRARRVHIGKEGEEVIADTEVKLMNKLHQVYSGSVLLDNRANEAMCFDDSKARFIAEYFKGQKIAIFYKFRAEFLMLQWAFKGQLTESPEDFNMRQDLVFASQIQSGREGINLSTADALVMFNIDYSHVSYLQSRARMQTKDREEPCRLYWVFAEGGMEEKIYEKVMNKQDYQLVYFKQDFKVTAQNKKAC